MPPSPDGHPDRPVIGISLGEPAGVGPEVVVKALSDPEVRRLARFVVFGLNELMAYAADLAEIEPFWHRVQHGADRTRHELTHDVVVVDFDELSFLGRTTAAATRAGGQASLAFLDAAVAAAKKPIAEGGTDAIVTAPICKESWDLAGCRFPGHTEFLQNRFAAKRVAMMFAGVDPAGEPIRVVLATIHTPLMDVRELLSIGRVFDAADLADEAVKRLGIPRPRIGVCGLNPHAGEGGLFGDEEGRLIAPAIDMAKEAGMAIHGPFPADTLFTPSQRKRYDLLVAMYHDQGLIPVKMLAFDNAVNVTLGLPVVRTSPDHGTAFDIAWKNRAEPESMKSAIRFAAASVRGAADPRTVADRG
ncbi:4-hydroxythreonine-4-phosphate dehydrogenase PdxA [Phycisphaera mikurensis]|uniref:4-hydroxythreonine-4-phosphate dehydrogenase n=1 Tax=Phycisphaera mikurensis (strain NBRC 102666 / KCTC 22515 / FYK2301M01) TaxID=1142394 RepID=I0IDK7_PHYMF|nr:4-hydroxythreonine-4-phosphate dehydrogenase PdxA [Phycisphaera mikurensis]MBB6441165.1 4-hydroxythreonine-4-phosphate dehydrogenase [Phycisphaera mikurensis]BAM03345.1 4-hydroxythreonine-4-phosphate dehydrogenase [Phycisphaera mikurensis NBRC 102666]